LRYEIFVRDDLVFGNDCDEIGMTGSRERKEGQSYLADGRWKMEDGKEEEDAEAREAFINLPKWKNQY